MSGMELHDPRTVQLRRRSQPASSTVAGLPGVVLPDGGKVDQELTVRYRERVRPSGGGHRSLTAQAWPGFRAAAGNAWAGLGVVVALSLTVVVLVLAFRLVGAAAHVGLPGGG